jgi:hypothetical protein
MDAMHVEERGGVVLVTSLSTIYWLKASLVISHTQYISGVTDSTQHLDPMARNLLSLCNYNSKIYPCRIITTKNDYSVLFPQKKK